MQRNSALYQILDKLNTPLLNYKEHLECYFLIHTLPLKYLTNFEHIIRRKNNPLPFRDSLELIYTIPLETFFQYYIARYKNYKCKVLSVGDSADNDLSQHDLANDNCSKYIQNEYNIYFQYNIHFEYYIDVCNWVKNYIHIKGVSNREIYNLIDTYTNVLINENGTKKELPRVLEGGMLDVKYTSVCFDIFNDIHYDISISQKWHIKNKVKWNYGKGFKRIKNKQIRLEIKELAKVFHNKIPLEIQHIVYEYVLNT